MSFKKFLFSFIIVLSFLFFAIYPNVLIASVTSSLTLWYTGVLPSLFPFAMGISMLTETGFAEYLGRKLDTPIRLIFRVNGCGAFPLIMGLLAGYPTGAKITADLYKKRLISREEAQCILSFCNNAGPIFITAAVGTVLMGSKHTGYILLFSTICANIITGILFGIFYPHKITSSSSKEYLSSTYSKPAASVISEGIYSASHILILIGGYIILFGIITSIIKTLGIFDCLGQNTSIVLTGLMEMTTGINALCQTDMYVYEKAILSAFFLSFGGLAIQLQISSFIEELPINRTVFILSQLFKAALASLITGAVIIF